MSESKSTTKAQAYPS